MLLWGDVGEILGLNEPGIITKLCESNGMKIVNEVHKPYTKYEFYPYELKKDIEEAKLSLFHIQKIDS